jgi:hypothetical protein
VRGDLAVFLLVLVAVGCTPPGAEMPRTVTDTPSADPRLYEEGWQPALAAATRAWAGVPLSAMAVAFVLDDHVTDASLLRVLGARVELDEEAFFLERESRAVATVVTGGRHTLSIEATISGPPCYYCAGPGTFRVRRGFVIDVASSTSVAVRVGAAAPGRVVESYENKLRIVVEDWAWRRLSEDNIDEIARVTADGCIDDASRHVNKDRDRKDLIKLVCHQDKIERCVKVRASVLDHHGLLVDARAQGDADVSAREIAELGVLQVTAARVADEIPYCGD